MRPPLFLLFAATLLACELDREAFRAPLDVEGPILVDGALHWLDGGRGRLISLEAGKEARITCRATPPHARGLVADEGELLYLAKEERPLLVHRRGKRESRMAVPALFDEIHLSPTGGEAILLFDPEAPPLPDEPPARNIARFAVADLEAGTTELIPLDVGGLARGAVFSEGGEWAAILLDRGVLVLDPADPQRRRTAHLELASGISLRPLEARFAPGGGHLVVLAEGIDEFLVFRIGADADRLDLVLNFVGLESGGRLRGFRIVDEERIAAIYDARIATLDLGGDTTRTRTRPLMGRGERVFALEGGKLLVAGPGEAGDAFVAVWDPETEDLDQTRIEGQIREIREVGGRTFVAHARFPASYLSVIEVGERGGALRLQQQSLTLENPPSALGFAEGAALVGTDAGDLVVVGAEDLAIDGLRLDAPIVGLGVVGSFLWALHPSPFGDISLVPADALSRSEARRFEGIFFAGLMGCE